MATQTSGLTPDLLDISFKEIFNMNWNVPQEWQRVLKSDTTDRQITKFSSLGGLGDAAVVPEGSDIPLNTVTPGYNISVTQVNYGVGVEVTDDAMRFDQFGLIKDSFSKVSRSMRIALENQAVRLYNEGFSSSRTGPDGLALFSTSHTREDGGPVLTNRPATDADLDVTSLRDGIITFQDERGSRGERLNLQPNKLVVANTAERFVGAELLKSLDRPDTPNRATNVLRDEGLSLVVWTYLSAARAWFLTGDDHKVYVLFSMQPDMKMEERIVQRVTRWTSKMSFALFWKDFRGTYGTSGT